MLEHDARAPQVVAVEQGVDEQQRVAGARVPAQHEHRLLGPGDAVVERRPRHLRGRQPQPEQQLRGPDGAQQQAAQDREVGLLGALAAQPLPREHEPQAAGGEQPARLEQDADDAEGRQADRPPPAGQHPRQQAQPHDGQRVRGAQDAVRQRPDGGDADRPPDRARGQPHRAARTAAVAAWALAIRSATRETSR